LRQQDPHCSEAELIRQVCEKSHKNFDSVRRALSRRKKNPRKLNPRSGLTESNFDAIVGITRAMADCGMPLSRSLLKEIIVAVTKAPVSDKRVRTLMKNSPHFKERVVKKTSAARLDVKDLEAKAAAYAKAVEESFKNVHVGEHNLIAFDQYRIAKNKEKTTVYFKKITGATRPDVLGEDYDDIVGSFMPYIIADGTLLLMVFILCSRHSSENKEFVSGRFVEPVTRNRRLRSCPSSSDCLLFFNESGCTNNVIQSFCNTRAAQLFQLRHPGLACLAICDNLACHRQPSMVERLWKEYQFGLCFTPPNLTHIYGILDGDCFATLSNCFQSFRSESIAKKILLGKPTIGSSMMSLWDSIDIAFSEKIIKNSFLKRFGKFPLNVSFLKSLLETTRHGFEIEPSTAANEAASVCRELIQSAAKETNDEHIVNVAVRKDIPYTTWGIMDLSKSQKMEQIMIMEKKIAEKEKIKKEKRKKRKEMAVARQIRLGKSLDNAVRRVENACRICNRKNTGELIEWRGCDYCEFWICGSCRDKGEKQFQIDFIKFHERQVPHRKRRRSEEHEKPDSVTLKSQRMAESTTNDK